MIRATSLDCAIAGTAAINAANATPYRIAFRLFMLTALLSADRRSNGQACRHHANDATSYPMDGKLASTREVRSTAALSLNRDGAGQSEPATGAKLRQSPAGQAMTYFEDLVVGAETTFGDYAVTREEVLDFARKYDPQPFHLSDEEAAKTHFGRLAASGWHTAAMTMAVIVKAITKDEQAGLGSPGVDDLRWMKPVYPGDTLTVSGKILDKTLSRSKPDIGSFRTETLVINQHDEPVMRFTSIVLMRRRPA
jgi:acyl dehydratase